MKFDLNKPYCFFFNEICKIPHGSKNEQQLSNWLVSFAEKRGLSWIQDDLFNVVIYKKASVGYEDQPGVIIQAHMDMVCEKENGVSHDFLKDPLELYVDGTHLRAKGTTLGADDGMGCAYMLSILHDTSLEHPFLECCFTTQEEVGLVGALNLKREYFKARQLINLDGAHEYRTYTSMGGGERISLTKDVAFSPVASPIYKLTIEGLLGGHSAGMINKERANAGKLAARVMKHLLYEGLALQLVSIASGEKHNVITASCEVVFTCDSPLHQVQEHVSKQTEAIAETYEFSDPSIAIQISSFDEEVRGAISQEETGCIVDLLYLAPYGEIAKSTVIEDLPIASSNLGVVRLAQGEKLEIVLSVRSALQSWIQELEMQVLLLARLFDFSVDISGYYPGWKYEAKSPLREKMCKVFEDIYKRPLDCLAGHGGNECGVFKKMHPDMDIVTSGAIYGSIHTTEEFLDLESFDRSYSFLTRFLATL